MEPNTSVTFVPWSAVERIHIAVVKIIWTPRVFLIFYCIALRISVVCFTAVTDICSHAAHAALFLPAQNQMCQNTRTTRIQLSYFGY